MLKELEDIGLSEKEAKVYLAALEIGRATADQLAKHAKIVRPTTYVQLDSLMKKGLMSTYEEGKKTYFAPESPELLRRLLMKQKDEINSKEKELADFLPDLLRQYESAGERPVVRFFPGKDGVAAVREEVLTTIEKKTYAVFSPSHLSEIFGDKYLDEYSDRRRSLGIHARGIYTHSEFFQRAGTDPLTERRFLSPDIFPITIDITVFDDKTAIFPLEGSLFGMVIQSKQMASSMKMIFNLLWMQAKGPAEN
jgi:sugar-specific transcriptional regulator TrmB